MLIIIYNIYIIYYYNIIYIIICNLSTSERRSKRPYCYLLFVICYFLRCLFPDYGWQFFAYFLMWLTVDLLNELTVFLISLTLFLVSLTFSWKCWHLLRRSPKTMKSTAVKHFSVQTMALSGANYGSLCNLSKKCSI